MIRSRRPDGPFLTKSMAAYPPAMNALLAERIVTQAREYKRLKLGSPDHGSQNTPTSQLGTVEGGDLRCEKASSSTDVEQLTKVLENVKQLGQPHAEPKQLQQVQSGIEQYFSNT